jgi:hypothetical protein
VCPNDSTACVASASSPSSARLGRRLKKSILSPAVFAQRLRPEKGKGKTAVSFVFNSDNTAFHCS